METSNIPNPLLQPAGTPKRTYQPTGQLASAIKKIEDCANLADECEEITSSMMQNAAGDAVNAKQWFSLNTVSSAS